MANRRLSLEDRLLEELAHVEREEIDVDDLLREIDDERANAAAKIQAHRKRKVVMANKAALNDHATAIQSRARGRQARKELAQQKQTISRRVRRASKQLFDLVTGEEADSRRSSATPATQPPRAQTPATQASLQTLPLATPSPAAPPSKAQAARREPLCCSCLSRGGGAGASDGGFFLGSASSAFDTPMLAKLISGLRFDGRLATTPRTRGGLYDFELRTRQQNVMTPRFCDSMSFSAASRLTNDRLSVGAAA